jgi:hypothetical protein
MGAGIGSVFLVNGDFRSSSMMKPRLGNPISQDDLFGCIEKLCKVRGELKGLAKREKRKIQVDDLPHLWLMVPTDSDKVLLG